MTSSFDLNSTLTLKRGKDELYPQLLEQTGKNAPEALHVMGLSGNESERRLDCLALFKRPAVAIVGTRRCTAYGEQVAWKFAKVLSEQGFVIVSGLAYGVDAAAHRGCVEAGGQTIAVVAQGLNRIQPAGNLGLARDIVANGGAIVSEHEDDFSGRAYEYLKRNRIISGLSLGVIVIEAGFKSGALNTAKHAVNQGRVVMGVPGRLTDPMSLGVLKQIQRGGHVITHPRDVVELLGQKWKMPGELGAQQLEIDLKGGKRGLAEGKSLRNKFKGLPLDVLRSLEKKAASLAELSEHFHSDTNELYGVLIQLELEGWIRQGMDRRYRLSQMD
jgi:DNA protecting protein DprA